MIINIPNEGEINIDRSIVEKWHITDIKIIGDVVFFSVDGSSMSMGKNDFDFPPL